MTPDVEDVVPRVAAGNDPEVSVDPETGEMVTCDPVIRNWTGIFGAGRPLYVTVT